jgi:hypothetical protein
MDTCLVGLVVVLRVVLEHLWPLRVVEGANELLYTDTSVFGPPLLAVDEPAQTCVSILLT